FEDVPYDWMYESVLPCVLLSKEEHLRYFHSVSRGKQSIEMYGVLTGSRAGGSPADRAHAAWVRFHQAKRTGDAEALAELREIVNKRATLLDDLHSYDPVLRAITDNVFRRAISRLDQPVK